MSAEENKQLVEKIEATFTESDTEAFLALCTDKIKWTMVGEKSVEGKQAIREWMAPMAGMDPPKFTTTRLVAEGDEVAAFGHMTMKDKDGKEGSYQYCDLYRFESGKVAELTSFMISTAPKAEHDEAKAAA